MEARCTGFLEAERTSPRLRLRPVRAAVVEEGAAVVMADTWRRKQAVPQFQRLPIVAVVAPSRSGTLLTNTAKAHVSPVEVVK